MNFSPSRTLLLLLAGALCAAGGCGNKGDLYLPDEPAATSAADRDNASDETDESDTRR